MSQPIRLRVDAPPPAKDGAKSIRSPEHLRYRITVALREKMAEVMEGHQPFTGVRLRMDVHYRRAASQADALNIINGIADVIQAHSHREDHRFDVSVLDDDTNIREFHYTEAPSEHDSYELVVRRLGASEA